MDIRLQRRPHVRRSGEVEVLSVLIENGTLSVAHPIGNLSGLVVGQGIDEDGSEVVLQSPGVGQPPRIGRPGRRNDSDTPVGVFVHLRCLLVIQIDKPERLVRIRISNLLRIRRPYRGEIETMLLPEGIWTVAKSTELLAIACILSGGEFVIAVSVGFA